MNKRERDLRGGVDFTAGKFEGARMLIHTILAWFTITAEAFLRHNFGERYYTRTNFFVGLILLTVMNVFGSMIATLFSADFGFVRLTGGDFNQGMGWLLLGYILFSLFHFWKIWANSQMGYPEHSLYNGTSHLEPLGRLIAKVLNPPFTVAAKAFGRVTLNAWRYERLEASLKITPPIKDISKFTQLWLEPLVVFIASFLLSGALSVWLSFSASALFLYSSLTYQNKRVEELDLADTLVESAFMKREAGTGKTMRSSVEELVNVVKERAATEPDYIEILREEKPSLFDALDELDIDLGTESEN